MSVLLEWVLIGLLVLVGLWATWAKERSDARSAREAEERLRRNSWSYRDWVARYRGRG